MPRKYPTPEEKKAREERLPAWAKDELQRLRRDLDLTLGELHAHRLNAYGPEDTDTKANPYDVQPLNLPKGASIEFTLGEKHSDVIRVRVTKEGLDVNGNGGVHVFPRASNSLVIRGGSL